jgi:predicted RNase H-like nuclease (RuvC/YqgF family)
MNRLLEKQEDILYEELDKFVSAQKSLALEIKRNEMLSSELSAYHETVSSLKSVNDDLNAKLEEANKSISCVEHVSICNRCKDFDVDACDEHLMSITKLNDEVASLNAQLKTCKINFDQLKFARDVSHPVLEGKPNANHVRARISNSRTQQLHNWTSSHSAQIII